MASEWQEVQIKDIVTVLGDGLHGTPIYDDAGDYYFINGNNLENGRIVFKDATRKVNHFEYIKHKKNLNDRTIFVSINGTIGNVAIYNGEKVILGKSACYLNVKSEVDKQFVRYIFTDRNFQSYIDSQATGTTIKNVSLKLMRDFRFNLPCFEEQKAIAHILGSLDDKIELNRQMNATLEAMAQALFKSWFVDFDPVIDNALAAGNPIPDELEAKAAARQALGDARKPLPEDIRSLFPNAFVFTEEMGWIPEGWEVVKLQELLDIKYGKDHKKLENGNIPVYGSGGIMRFADKALYQGESILIPRKGTLSNLMYVDEEFWTVDTMFYSIPKTPIFAKYLFYYLKTFDFNSMNVGSAVPSMTTKVLNDLNTPNPDVKVLISFDALLSEFFNKMKSINNQSKSLEQLRDTLLPKLLSGELRIPEAERLVEESVA